MEEKTKNTENSDKEFEDSQNSSLETEINAGEWQTLNRFEIYRKRSRQGKIIATHKALTNRLNQLVSLYYQLVRNQPKKAIKLLNEIKKLRFLQDYLLNCLIWEERGEFEEHQMPEELEGLV